MKVREILGSAMIFFALISPGIMFANTANAQEQTKPFAKEQIDQMLAPIALYPDSLLAQIFMASTYPIQIVQADRFAKKNKNLKGDKLLEAAKNEDWDPSVKSLLQFPEVLAMMSDKLDWTTNLGDAFLAQKVDVMDSIQRLRKQAYDAGNLKTTKEQVVKVEKETIIIQPSNPQVIYVPAYSTTVVYGPWPYPAYPPYPYYPPGYGAAAATFGFAVGVAVGSSGCCWGSWNWSSHDIDIDIDHNYNFNRDNYNKETAQKYQQQLQDKRGQQGKQEWQHNAENRKGVAYRDNATAQKFNRGTSAQAARSREAFRGRSEQGRPVVSRGGAERGGGAFSGMDRGSGARDFSSRGQSSRQSMSRGGAKGFGGGGGFGGGRSGGRR